MKYAANALILALILLTSVAMVNASTCVNAAGGNFCGGKGEFNCFCDAKCEKLNDCCSDFRAVCNTSPITGKAASSDSNNIAIGEGAVSEGLNSIAIGKNSNSVNNEDGISIGTNSFSTFANGPIAIGRGSFASGSVAIAIGQGRKALGGAAIGIGYSGGAFGLQSIAIGDGASAGNMDVDVDDITKLNEAGGPIAIGGVARAFPRSSLAIGRLSRVGDKAEFGIAIGPGTNSGHFNSIALGALAKTTEPNQLVIGNEKPGEEDLINLGTTAKDVKPMNVKIFGGLTVANKTGIGTTKPLYQLQVNVPRDGMVIFGTTAGGNARHVLSSDTAANALIRSANNVDLRLGVNEDAITMKRGGNVGIGTTNPGSKLSIAGLPRNPVATGGIAAGRGVVCIDSAGNLFVDDDGKVDCL